MRKIINKKMYDTDTARLLAEYETDYRVNDFRWYREELYRKQTGEFFLYGEGNADSQYAKRIYGNTWTSGKEIYPMSEEEARVWAETCVDVDQYIAIFGEVEE